MNTDLMFSSATDQWATPQAFFNEWDDIYHFELDVCADASNAKCRRYFSEQDNGLAQNWAPYRCWMNPPYGREIRRWIQKAYQESLRGATVVCLLPARTDTAWWHEYIIPFAKMTFVRGRLKFGDATNSTPFASVVAVFYPRTSQR